MPSYRHNFAVVIVVAAISYFAGLGSAHAVWETLVDGTSFNSSNSFEAVWSYNYPWGEDHNGTAHMESTNIVVTTGMVTMVSTPTNSYQGNSSKDPFLPIRYNSATFYLKQKITISAQFPILDVSGEFQVPSQRGTWPAFWLTGANSWPPESDIMEFKGNATCWQNTYTGSWQETLTPVPSPDNWHHYRVVATLINTTNVDLHYYIDGVLKAMHTAATFVGKSNWLIIDLQMEGASGSPGPVNGTSMRARNIIVKRENVSGVGNGPVANGNYKILAQSTGQGLDVANQYTTNNSYLVQWTYGGGVNQQWNLTHRGNNQYAIIGRQSGRALEVMDGSVTNGARLVVRDYGAGSNQIWTLTASSNGYYNLINLGSGKALQVRSNSPTAGAAIDQWTLVSALSPTINTILTLGPNIVLTGSGGVAGFGFAIRSSLAVATPQTNWSLVATSAFNENGNFSFTNGIDLGIAQKFFRLQATNSGDNQHWIFQPP